MEIKSLLWLKCTIRGTNDCRVGRHSVLLLCNDKEDYALCNRCGLRTPSYPHDGYANAEQMFKIAKKAKTLYAEDEGKAHWPMGHF